PLSRKLSVTATPRDKTLEPGGNTLINVEAKDSSGTAVKDSEIAVVVVDESVLALTAYKLDDPISIFDLFFVQRSPHLPDGRAFDKSQPLRAKEASDRRGQIFRKVCRL